ncbi:branched-chain amino acid ABC transporter permease [Verrucosispora sp. NA02020]|uniref:branched-chain amino acid ABC transporter permease n=1 Tax=Verrucosispora sp. NA02020 TaxID=2742132 RepID=UPI00158FB306|nr:branched-chain amino acid ABC transporter permease [Verrucosispora sp. NA02020]QKW13572.1 branched-chain amino acid ABC transporter permease [Verrucosispora sp. NA02020]
MRRAIPYLAAALVAIALPLALTNEPYWLDMLALLGFWAALAGSWNLLAGYTGQVSLGHAAFSGIGAYSTALAATKLTSNALVGLLLGVVLAAAIAAIVGLLTLRLRGPYFSIATIAFAQVASITALNWKDVTGGAEGIFLPFEPGPANLMFESPATYAIIFLLCAVLIAAATAWMAPSRTGLFLRAIRDDPVAAASLGVRVTALKLAVFAVSAAIAAAMGALNAARIGYVDPTGTMTLQLSIQVALIAAIGGMGSPAGPLIGAIGIIPLQFLLRAELGGRFGALYLAVYGLLLVIVLRYAPGGVVDLATRAYRRIRPGPTPPAMPPPPAPATTAPEEVRS